MSLDFNFKNIANYEAIDTDAEWPKTESIIWNCLFTGIGWELTEERVPEFMTRVRIIDALGGYKTTFTIEDVLKRVGLSVNVSYETRAAWVKRIVIRDYEKFVAGYKEKIVELHAAEAVSK